MKKLLALMMASIMVFSLVACGGGFAGEWKATGVDAEMSAEEKALVETFISGISISANDDGTATMSAMGQTKEIEWEADGNTISLTDGGETLKGELDGDKFILEMDGQKIIFEKQ